MGSTAVRAAGSGATHRRRCAAVACALLLALTLVAGACSGDSDAGTAASTTTEQRSSDTDGSAVSGDDVAVASDTDDDAQAPSAATDPESEFRSPGATVAPVAIDEVSEFGNGVTARLTTITARNAEATVPGETSGPAVAVDVEITNGSDSTIDLGNVTVDLTDSSGGSATRITSVEPTGFSGPLVEGESSTATYLFRLAPDDRDAVTITVKYSADTPIAVFTGSVPNA